MLIHFFQRFIATMTSCRKTAIHSFVVLMTFMFLTSVSQLTIAMEEPDESLNFIVATLNENSDPDVRIALLQGMLSGLEGRRNVAAPKGWKALSESLAKSKNKTVRELSNQLSQVFGDQEAIQNAISLLKDKNADVNKRREALRSLMSQQNEEGSQLLESLLDEPALCLDAIRGYAMVENNSAPAILLQRYPQLDPELRRAVIETLATRKSYAETLLGAMNRKTISPQEIPAHVARSLKGILGDRFVKVFGEVKSVARDREKLMAKYKKMLNPAAMATADPVRGRAVFEKTCASCHLLYGEGGKVGPDLTGSNRANLDYILLNSIDPSYDVPEGYKMVIVETVKGRIISGVVAEEDGSRLVLKTAEQPRVVIAKDDIEDRYVSPQSMMPDGQLDQMKPQEVVDLIEYLRTTEQVEKSK